MIRPSSLDNIGRTGWNAGSHPQDYPVRYFDVRHTGRTAYLQILERKVHLTQLRPRSARGSALPYVRNRVFMPPKNIDHPRALTENGTREKISLEFVDVRQIYEVEAPRLRRYFQARMHAGDDAGDLVQESFARLLGCLAKTSLPRPAAYLQRIARNLLLDRRKRLETRLAAFHVPLGEQHDPAVAPDQAVRIEVEDMMHAYRRALGELPERTRNVFLLHRVDELTYKQISGRLGISIPTVQYHVARALAHIDAALEQE